MKASVNRGTGITFSLILCLSLLLFSSLSFGKTYNLDKNKYPPCNSGSWYKSGATLICNGQSNLNKNDKITSSTSYTLRAKSGFRLRKNTIGKAGTSIHLETTYGDFVVTDNGSRIYGSIASTSGDISVNGSNNKIFDDVSSNSGDIVLANTSVSNSVSTGGAISLSETNVSGNVDGNDGVVVDGGQISGSVSASNGSVTITGSDILGNISGANGSTLEGAIVEGTVTASNGDIVVENSLVEGKLTSGCCSVTVTNSQLFDGLTAHDPIFVSDSSIDGNVIGNHSLEFQGVTMATGDIEAKDISITGSTIGTEDSRVDIDSSDGWADVMVDDVTVYGDLFAPNYADVVVNGNSSIFGVCLPSSEPADACVASKELVLSWQMDEEAWLSGNSSVIDSSGNNLHGTANNGVNTDSAEPALSADSLGFGTCHYGTFNGQNQFVEVAHNAKLSFDDNFTVSAWIKPTAYPPSGQLKSIVSKDTNYEFHLNSNKKIFWWWQQHGSGAQHSFESHREIPLEQWTHVTIRYQVGRGSDKTSQWIFINGQEDSSWNTKHKAATNTAPFQVGQDQGINERFFNGSIDEVRVFNTALTDSQIAELAKERHPCGDTVTDPSFRYGRLNTASTETTVTFEQAFPVGSNPLVFLSPSINASTPDQDGPSTLRLVSVTNTGFTVRQVEPNAPKANYTSSQPMPSIDYVAVLPGKITLSNGQELYAGTFELRSSIYNRELQGSIKGNPTDDHRGWKSIIFPRRVFTQTPTLMLEIQSNNNTRWLTAAGNEVSQRRFKVALEQSEVSGGNANNSETVAYLAAMPGHGTFDLFGRTVGYDFQHARSGVLDGVQSFKTRCDETTPFEYKNFPAPPVMVVGKLSRSGNNGGWIRRCHRDSKQMSIVMDEDQDSDKERSHVVEDVSYLAFSVEPDEIIPEFEFGPYPEAALTCVPVNITVNVVDRNGLPITDYVGQIGLETSSDKGDWQLHTGNGHFVAGNPDSGNASYQYSASDQGSATFSLNYLHVGTVNIVLSSSSGEELNKTNGITFKAEGLTLQHKEGFPYGRKTAIANKPIGYELSAVTEDPAAKGQCKPIASFSDDKRVSFSFEYSSPASNKELPTVNGTELNASSDTELTMTFKDGVADLDFNYAEAGAIKLTVKQAEDVTLPPDDPSKNWLAQEIINVSPWLVVSSTAGNKFGTAGDSDKGFKAAGEIFHVSYKGVVWDSDVSNSQGQPISAPSSLATTKNFTGSYPAEVVAQDISPSGGNSGALTFPDKLTYSSGVSPQLVEATYGEVGSLKLGGVAAGNYLITNNDIPFYTYSDIGRFYPKYLELSDITQTSNCNGSEFNYFGNRNSVIKYTLTAKNTQGKTTRNYESVKYAALAEDTHLNLNGENADNGVSLKSRIETNKSALSWKQGATSASWVYEVTKNAEPQYPYNNFVLSLEGTGPDIVPLSPLNENPAETGSSPGTTSRLAGDLIFRWGRVRLIDAYGPEIAPIRAPFFVEYFNSAGAFVTNEEDRCTTLSLANFKFVEGSNASSLPVGGGSTEATLADLDHGEGSLSFSAPGEGNRGVVTPQLNLQQAGYPWLRVDQTGNGEFDDVEEARIQFGLYRGSDRIIWWREKTD